MKQFFIPIIILGLIIGTPVTYELLRHTPSQWEMAVQKVAQDGDTCNLLFSAMKEFDSIATVARYDEYDDSFMSKWLSFYGAFTKNHPEGYEMLGATERWKSGMYDFAYNYYGTSAYGLMALLTDKKIYAIPVSWWHRPIAPFK